MTREEARDIMGVIVHMLDKDYDTERVEEAVEMAISALNSLEEVYAKGYNDGFTQAEVNYENDKALEQEPCEEFINVPQKALKFRSTNFVGYNVEWLKKHWQMEMDIVCGVKPCDDAVSRDAVLDIICRETEWYDIRTQIEQLPSVTQKSGKCKNCKYFEYDSVAKVDGVPLIVAHEICNKWGDGCKTSEDGYCYLFEPQERSE